MKAIDDRKAVMDAVLIPAGFRRKGNNYLRASPPGPDQWVGFRRSRYGDRTAAIHFASDANAADSGGSHGLSWVAPFKNTSWWPEQLSELEQARLTHHLENVALPFLDSWDGGFDENAAVERIHDCVSGLICLRPGFERKDNSYFRRRGQVIDIVDVELLGDCRFAFVYVAVWHKGIRKGMDLSLPAESRVPEGVTRVASHSVGLSAIDGVPCSSLYFLGNPRPGTLGPGPSMVSVADEYFGKVNDVRDVLNQIRPEYRAMFPA